MDGIEIGPLANPVVRKNEGPVRYADHANTEELRRKYQGHGWDTNTIVDVDISLSGRSLLEAIGRGSTDYVIASHVFEHIADPVTWLHDVHTALRPGGIVSLVIPDKRYCFDAKRPTSTTGELVDSFLAKRTNPTFKQVYDFWACYCSVDAGAVWSGAVDPMELPFSGTRENAYRKCLELKQSTAYADVHCWVFTPDSFMKSLGELAELSLLPFRPVSFFPTQPGDLEFFVSLQAVDSNAVSPDRAAHRDAFLKLVSGTAMSATPTLAEDSTERVYREWLERARPVYRLVKSVSPVAAEKLKKAFRV